MARDPFRLYPDQPSLDKLNPAFKRSERNPPIGVTQGGSSRKNAGCKPAATDGHWRPSKTKKEVLP